MNIIYFVCYSIVTEALCFACCTILEQRMKIVCETSEVMQNDIDAHLFLKISALRLKAKLAQTPRE